MLGGASNTTPTKPWGARKKQKQVVAVDPHQLFSFPFSIFNFRFLEELRACRS